MALRHLLEGSRVWATKANLLQQMTGLLFGQDLHRVLMDPFSKVLHSGSGECEGEGRGC